MRSYQIKRKNNIIIGVLCAVLLLMAVGYAAFSSLLNITGTSSVSSNWDIEITNIRGGNPGGGDAYDISEPTYTPTTATFNTGLKTPWNWQTHNGSYREYEVEVTNKGTLEGLVTISNLSCGDNETIGCDAVESDKKTVDDNWNYIELTEKPSYMGFEQEKQDYSDMEFTIAPGEKHYIYVDVWYEDVTNQPDKLDTNINLELNYEQVGHENLKVDASSNILKMNPFRSIDSSSIVTATFLNTNEVPSNATKSWDASVAKDKSVMAWIVPSTNNSDMYDLYVGADGEVIANQNSSELFYNFDNLQTINFGNNFDTSNVTDMSHMFSGCESLTSLNLSNFDTGKVTDMGFMFAYCYNLTTLDVSNFDTSNVTNMRDMFSNCSNLTTLDVSNFDTSKVIDMSSMFNVCESLTTLDVSNFDTSKVIDMSSMFNDCSSLTTLNVSNFDTSKVIDMSSMFCRCEKLTVLNLSNFNTKNVTDMGYMFLLCGNLTSLDLSSFNTVNVTDMYGLFMDCNKLKTIYVGSKWTDANAIKDAMFSNCGTSSVTRK